MLLLGNDIVDVNQAGMREKSKDTRFMQRVFTAAEQDCINTADNPALTLWIFWAAKESAFKLVSKMCGPPVFSHPKFEVSAFRQTAASSFKAEVVYRNHSFSTLITHTKGYIHAVGGNLPADAWPQFLMISDVREIAPSVHAAWQNKAVWHKAFTPAELESIHHATSALVRFFCKKSIAAALKIRTSQLQIIRPVEKKRPQPPFVLCNDRPCNIDISLSHHGSWLGWCFNAGNRKKMATSV